MTTRIKTLALASALALGTVSPAGAVFVKPKIESTSAAGAAAIAGESSDAIPASAATTSSTSAVRAKHKKRGFFRKVGRFFQKLAGDSQLVALLLGIFLGGFGIHRFYLGYTTIGILQLLMLVVGSVLSLIIIGIPILIALFVWVLIDIIRIATGDLGPKGGSYSETL